MPIYADFLAFGTRTLSGRAVYATFSVVNAAYEAVVSLSAALRAGPDANPATQSDTARCNYAKNTPARVRDMAVA